MLSARQLTLDEFWDYIVQHPLEEGYYELNEGAIEMAGGTGGRHGQIAMRLSAPIYMFVEQHALGTCTAAETCYAISAFPAIVRCPDFAFVSQARAPQPLPSKYVPFPPDFAVEVKSPSDSLRKLRQKCEEYLRHGVRLVWLVLPENEQVEVYQPEQDILIARGEDALLGYEVLLGFSLPTQSLFPR